jgi:hypothetical protein
MVVLVEEVKLHRSKLLYDNYIVTINYRSNFLFPSCPLQSLVSHHKLYGPGSLYEANFVYSSLFNSLAVGLSRITRFQRDKALVFVRPSEFDAKTTHSFTMGCLPDNFVFPEERNTPSP